MEKAKTLIVSSLQWVFIANASNKLVLIPNGEIKHGKSIYQKADPQRTK